MIESPCIGVCTIVCDKCVGCTRTSEEISNWLFYTDNERKSITKRCLRDMKSDRNNLKNKNI